VTTGVLISTAAILFKSWRLLQLFIPRALSIYQQQIMDQSGESHGVIRCLVLNVAVHMAKIVDGFDITTLELGMVTARAVFFISPSVGVALSFPRW
jgi:hypothetical protein